MKFKLSRQILPEEFIKPISRAIRQQGVKVRLASKQMLQQIAEACSAIESSSLPSYLIRKKLPGNLGYGIFLHPKADPILKGTVIAPYAGIVSLVPQNTPDESSGDYAFEPLANILLTKKEQLLCSSHQKYHPRRLYSLKLDALNRGNFTRFINHSDQPNITAELISIKSKNAQELNSSPLEVLYMAKKTIYPGEQLLICYEGEDKSYWGASNIKPFPMTSKTFQLKCLKGNHCQVVKLS
jgi:hypothetical protein